MQLLAWDPAKKKTVLCGSFDKEKSLLVRKVEPKHFMRVLQGYGIQDIAFQEICKLGIKYIGLKEIHAGDTLYSKVEVWKDKGAVKDYGHGKQRFLSIKYMKRRKYVS